MYCIASPFYSYESGEKNSANKKSFMKSARITLILT